MENSKFGKKLDAFLAGKGFYIVLFLCVAIIGVSAWSLVRSGSPEPAVDLSSTLEGNGAISGDYGDENDYEALAPDVVDEAPTIIETPPDTAQTGTWTQDDVWAVSASPYARPMDGEIQREYSMETLSYDVTMADWRVHDGVDFACADGAIVKSVHAGTVKSIETDDLYGVTVVVDQGGGMLTTYANLKSAPAVRTGDQVSAGDIIGYVGGTALCETAQEPHLHLSMSLDGKSVNPSEYLPG